MIVFHPDWKLYPSAIVDTKTRNKSFLELTALYRDMGVEHYYFHLALLQPDLQGVDPYSEDLTLEQKVMIMNECDNNPWYYLREIVIDPGGGIDFEDKCFKANRSNIAAMWLILACIDYIQIQPRQTGKSFGADLNNLWLMYFKYRDTAINLITKDETLRKSNIARLKKLRDAWPSWLCRNTKKDDNNQISLSCNSLNNKYYTHVSQSSEKAANNLGRGLTSPFIQIDEAPFINHIKTTISSAMGSMNAARENAKKLNAPYCTVFTTTAGNQEDRDGRYVYGLMADAAEWSERFLDCKTREELVELINTNSHGRATTVNLTMSAQQVGKSDEWLYEAVVRARGDGDNVDRDYFNVWTNSSSESILAPNIAKTVRESEKDAIDVVISADNYLFKWYEPINPDVHYILSVDTSDAIGRDDIAVLMINTETGATAGAATFNETNLIQFAKWLLNMLVDIQNSTLLIENRYNAQTIIDYLLLSLPKYGEDPFKRIFNRIVQDKDKHAKTYDKIMTSSSSAVTRAYEENRRDFGFHTDANTRKLLYSNVLKSAAKDVGHVVHDSKLIQQMLGLVIKNNRIDHTSEGHDDMVVAWLMAHWLLNHGVNLSHYGIDSTKVMQERAINGKEMTPQEMMEHEHQRQLNLRIKEVHDKLKNTSDFMEIARLERELGQLMTEVKVSSTDSNTLDAMIEEARQTRQEARKAFGAKGKGTGVLLSQYGR